jgi:thiamine biosynthesis lipoprotein
MSKKEIYSLVILLLVFGFAAWQYTHSSFTETKSQHLMDTVVRITATAKDKNVGTLIDSVFTYISALDKKLNDYDPDSWISQLNRSESPDFPMDPDVYQILVIADSLYRMTGGAFDPTIKPVYDLWGFSSQTPSVTDSLPTTLPDSLLLATVLRTVGFDKVTFNERTIRKPTGTQLGFGAIAKGYILDKAKQYMQKLGISSGFIDCRSSMILFGDKIPQLVYIQHPRLSMTDHIASFKIKNLAVGTSGDYQQYYEIGGKRYHHILDPKTGYPVPNMYSSTVIHPSAAWADGLSTALFLMEPNRAISAIKSIPGCNAIIYYEQDGSPVSLKSLGMKDLSLDEKL